MSESPQHLNLVKRIRDEIRSRDDVIPSLVEAEDHEERTTTVSMPEGCRPDVYYFDNKNLILGEAKTSNDLLNYHSDAQFESYFKYLQAMACDSIKATLYIGVPWEEFRWAINHFKKKKPDTVNVIILNDCGMKEKL